MLSWTSSCGHNENDSEVVAEEQIVGGLRARCRVVVDSIESKPGVESRAQDWSLYEAVTFKSRLLELRNACSDSDIR